jgi:tRNA dimethylallyltransferase
MWCYLAGEYDWETMRHKGIVATRQLAKRQLTWLRKEADLLQLDPYALPLDAQVKRVVEYYSKNNALHEK